MQSVALEGSETAMQSVALEELTPPVEGSCLQPTGHTGARKRARKGPPGGRKHTGNQTPNGGELFSYFCLNESTHTYTHTHTIYPGIYV